VQLAVVPLLLVLALMLVEPFGGVRTAAAADGGGAEVDLRAQPWSFANATGDPQRFRAWWQRLTGEWNAKDRGCALVQRPDPLGELPFVLQPGTSTRFFESTIRVNNLGLRGADAPRAKGDAFRIVCLGESTTMGQTLFAEDRPWPEVLQQLLNTPARGRRIEVLNAGWASYDVRHSAIRLRRFVLDLEPDLVVVYHGYNGFWMLLPDVAEALVAGSRLPQRTPRPSWVLAAAEHGLRVAAFRRSLVRSTSATVDPDTNPAATAYREILARCGKRGIRVGLCSFNMAVNAASPAEAIAFYAGGFPQVERQIIANRMQTVLLRRLAAGHDHATFVDTGRLDGAFADAFVDLVHFTQAGRDRLAAAVADGIRDLLPQ
jgi:lysophospholipase L1-like esterase